MNKTPQFISISARLALGMARDRLRLWPVVLAFHLLGQISASGASHYIRAAATGAQDGSTWNNAWTNFAAVTWTRGDTYYLAGGTYTTNGTAVITKPVSGSSTITLKKANAADNSGDAGWNAAFATAQSLIVCSNFQVWEEYIHVDGVTGSGTSGHGIKVQVSNTNSLTLFQIYGLGPNRIAGVEVAGPGFGSTFAGSDGIYHVAIPPASGITIERCWIHDVTRNGITFVGHVGTSYADYGFQILSNVISEVGGSLDVDAHGQGIEAAYSVPTRYVVIRDNVLRNVVGTAMIAGLGNSAGETNASYRDWLIYNNVFHITDNALYNIVSPAVIYLSSLAQAVSNIVILNNTFYGIGPSEPPFAMAQIALDTPGTTNNLLANNIWENCYFSATHRGFAAASNSNNGYFGNTGAVPSGTQNQTNGTASTLLDPAGQNFRLKAGYAVNHGLDFSSAFTADADGQARTAPWELGAYGFYGEPAPAASAASIGRLVLSGNAILR